MNRLEPSFNIRKGSDMPGFGTFGGDNDADAFDPAQHRVAQGPPSVVFNGTDLMDLVKNGTADAVRGFFDAAFWAKHPVVPHFQHLAAALARHDADIARVLVTWGAVATDDDIDGLKAHPDYTERLRTLRRAGHRVTAKQWSDVLKTERDKKEIAVPATVPPADPLSDGTSLDSYRLSALPEEWLRVLKKVQEKGAPEAVIAGGALRDTFNARAVKDVDIFLRGDKRNAKKFLRKVFNDLGLGIRDEMVRSGTYGGDMKTVSTLKEGPGGKFDFNADVVDRSGRKVRQQKFSSKVESWSLTTNSGTEYNFVFMYDWRAVFSGKNLNVLQHGPGRLIRNFDAGLCQIATDGKKIFATELYKKDVRDKTVTIGDIGDTTKDHLDRIMKKYPDFTPDEKAKEILGRKPKPPNQPDPWY